jgi:Na+-driven multidrug efflux pump
VLEYARSYLRWAGPAFGFFGLGLTLYFAAQGAGNVRAPIVGSVLRFLFVLAVGHAFARHASGPSATFAVVAGAMVLYGLVTALGVHLSQWQAQQRPLPAAGAVSRAS